MQRINGIVEEVFIPTLENQDVMFSTKIGFKIIINGELYSFIFDQDEEVCSILKNDQVELIHQVIDNKEFIDIRKIDEYE